MKLKNNNYHILKFYNEKFGFTYYKLECEAASCSITVLDENKPEMSIGLMSYQMKAFPMKGWILDGHYPFEYQGNFCREESERIIESIQAADDVADDLIQFRTLLKNRCEIEVDEYRFPPEETNKIDITNES